MLDFAQIMSRMIVAMVCGSIMGLEREVAGKEAGVRTEMLVSGGSALFTLAALNLPYILGFNIEHTQNIIATNSGFLMMIGNIVVGVGFLGAGIIMKTPEHIHGLTTAALVWTTAAIGIISGLGLYEISLASTIFISGTLYLLRQLNISERVSAVRD